MRLDGIEVLHTVSYYVPPGQVVVMQEGERPFAKYVVSAGRKLTNDEIIDAVNQFLTPRPPSDTESPR